MRRAAAVALLSVMTGAAWSQTPPETEPLPPPGATIDRPLPPPPPLRDPYPTTWQSPPPYVPATDWFARRSSIGGPPGVFADIDLAFLWPDVRMRDGHNGAFGQSADFDLNPDLATTFRLGYNFENDLTSVFASYRFFGADGSPNVDGAGLPVDIGTRLDVNDVNWTVQQRIPLFWDRLRFAVEGGARLSTIFYDLSYRTEYPAFIGGGPFEVELKASSHFVGAGPTVGLANEFELLPGLSLFARSDFAALFGRHTFKTRVDTNAPFLTVLAPQEIGRSATVKTLGALAGLTWVPANMPHLTFQFGYQFEYWWDVGKFGDLSDDLMFNGLFGRVRINY